MKNYEKAILARQESEADDCKNCPYRGKACNNQCEVIHVGRTLEQIYPGLFAKNEQPDPAPVADNFEDFDPYKVLCEMAEEAGVDLSGF